MEEKKVLFKNTSKMDDEEISLFQNFALKKKTIISSVVFSLVFVGGGVGMCFVDLNMGITLLVCGLVGGCVLLPYLMKEMVKKQNKITLGDKKYLNTFEFYEDYVFVTSEATPNKESNEYKPMATQNLSYNEIYQVVSYKEFLFIYLNKAQSFIVNFRGMTKGTIGEVIELLKSKGIKFIDKSNEPVPSKNELKK